MTLKFRDQCLVGDCLEVLPQLKTGCIDLVLTDPPFNQCYEYEDYIDDVSHEEFVEWCGKWMKEVHRVLKPSGTFWMAMGDKFVADLAVLARSCGFAMRNWIVWHYGFGQYTEHKFTRCHGHLLYFIKNLDTFTFNNKDTGLRIPSDRLLKYKDKRANPNGKVPGSVWEVPRVAGSHRERLGWHPAQMPERVLARIVRACSVPDENILDPFGGTGSTGAVAKKLGRRYTLIESSPHYHPQMQQYLDSIEPGDPIHGENL